MKSRTGFRWASVGVLLVVLFVGLPGCAKAKESGRYYSDNGYSIRLPEGWKQKPILKQADVSFVKVSDGQSAEIINVVSQAVRRGTAVVDVFRECLQKCELNLPGFEKNEEGDAILDGQAAKWMVFSGRTGEDTVKFLAYVTVRGEFACVITCSASADTFDQSRPQFEETAKSLRFE